MGRFPEERGVESCNPRSGRLNSFPMSCHPPTFKSFCLLHYVTEALAKLSARCSMTKSHHQILERLFSLVPLAWWHGRAVQLTPERRRALFERSEFARRRSQRTAQGTRRATPRPTWFWLLLPKQKWLGCRAETRQHRKRI